MPIRFQAHTSRGPVRREFRFGTRNVFVVALAAVLLVVLVTAGAALLLAGLAVAVVLAIGFAAVRGVARLLGGRNTPTAPHDSVRREPVTSMRDGAIDVEHEVLEPAPPGRLDD